MTEPTESAAIEISRKKLEMDTSVPASAWRVENLARVGDDYFLVVFGGENAAVAVAAVGCERGDIKSSARLTGNGPHLAISAEKALAICDAYASVQVDMVWYPDKLSRSHLYPIWRIHTLPTAKYVGQSGEVTDSLGGEGPLPGPLQRRG